MYRLLIVDDEPRIRNGLCNYFPWDEVGFEVAGEAENGVKALAFIQNQPVDVILCDIKMPVMSGIDLAKELFDRKSRIKIIFLSGHKEFEYAQKALVYGVKNYILKPTRHYELFEVFSALKLEMDSEQPMSSANSSNAAGLPEDTGGTSTDKVIQSIKNYVNEHYRDATLEEAAGMIHMNLYYVSKLFKKRTGQNFSDYVISVKMKKSTELLSDFNYMTYEVGYLVGYESYKNFARTFKKHFGQSPRQYRDSLRLQEIQK